MESGQLGCSYSHLGGTLSLNLGGSTVKVTGDPVPAKRGEPAGHVATSIHSIPGQGAKSRCVTWVSLSVPSLSPWPSSLQLNSIPNTWGALILRDGRLFRRKTDLFIEYLFFVSVIPHH